MTEGLEEGQIIKVDVKGRSLVSRQRREALLDEFEKSGMSSAAFAKWAGIKYPTFALWVKKRREARGAEPSSSGMKGAVPSKSIRWVEALMEESAKSVGVMVHFPGGARMEIGDQHGAMLAAEVLRQLQRPQRGEGC